MFDLARRRLTEKEWQAGDGRRLQDSEERKTEPSVAPFSDGFPVIELVPTFLEA